MAEVRHLLDQFQLLDEAPAAFSNWLHLVASHAVTGKQVHDARLVAVMQAHGVTHLLTFNVADFRRYSDITVVHPDDVA
jgi:predicted nucleic acid-binding protein